MPRLVEGMTDLLQSCLGPSMTIETRTASPEKRQGQGYNRRALVPARKDGRRSDGQPAQSPSERILPLVAVDDDSLVLLNMGPMLEDLGHTVFSATSGRQALEILWKGVAIDLMVTDQAMPEMTGAMLAEAARNERPNLRVILATGYDELPRGIGLDLVKLAKPFSQTDLEQAVARALRSEPQGRSPSHPPPDTAWWGVAANRKICQPHFPSGDRKQLLRLRCDARFFKRSAIEIIARQKGSKVQNVRNDRLPGDYP